MPLLGLDLVSSETILNANKSFTFPFKFDFRNNVSAVAFNGDFLQKEEGEGMVHAPPHGNELAG